MVVVILGNKTKHGKASSDQIERMNLFMQLYKFLELPVDVILSGKEDEVECMTDWLHSCCTNHQLSSINIIQDAKARNTVHNLQFVKEYTKEVVYIVTSDYHIARVNMICSLVGVNALVVGSTTRSGLYHKLFMESLFCVLLRIFGVRLFKRTY